MPKKTSSPHLKFAVLSTDIVTFKIQDKVLKTLLGKVQANPFYPNQWAAIGGLIRPEETAEESVDRLLKDKAGLKNIYKEQLYTFSDIERDPRGRVVSVAYIGITKDMHQTLDHIGIETMWVPLSKIPKLAYDHNAMIHMAIERLQGKLGYTNIAQYFLPDEFTLSDLQNVYEIVLGRGMDKRNFRKKLLASGMLKDTQRTRKEGVMRPAALYSFSTKKIEVVEIL